MAGSLAYIAGQLPVSQFLGPYLPDVAGAPACFAVLLLLLQVWRPKTVLGYGGEVLTAEEQQARTTASIGESSERHAIWAGFLPFLVLIVVVVLWTGPWSPLPKGRWFYFRVLATSSISH